ncbi:MAG: efflux RND transporter periplasmic adaptor subunit [Planctomycetota bacterium]|jgi:RND family efflux transporter MFP subunit
MVVIAIGAMASGLWAADDEAVEAITRPSKDVTLSFTRPGRVAEVLVTDGDDVTAGTIIVRLDDDAEQAALAQLKAESEDTVRVEAADAKLAQSRVDLKKIEWAAERGAATALEVEHAKLDVLIAELSLKLAKFEREQAGRKYEEARLQLARMRMQSSIDGKVERVFVEVGESVDALAEVVRVVSTDPLWIDAAVPLEQAATLKIDQPALVTLHIQDQPDEEPASTTGKIIHIASVADAASDTLIVRVEVSNAKGVPAGQRVWVSFPSSTETTSEPKDGVVATVAVAGPVSDESSSSAVVSCSAEPQENNPTSAASEHQPDNEE